MHEMRQLLERRAESADDAKAVLARLRQNKYLDDARFAAEFARVRGLARRQGRYRIARELRQRGVPDRYIEARSRLCLRRRVNRSLLARG